MQAEDPTSQFVSVCKGVPLGPVLGNLLFNINGNETQTVKFSVVELLFGRNLSASTTLSNKLLSCVCLSLIVDLLYMNAPS